MKYKYILSFYYFFPTIASEIHIYFSPSMLTAPSLALNVLTWPTLGSTTPPPLLPAPRLLADCLSPLQPLETAAPNVNVVKSKSNYANAR